MYEGEGVSLAAVDTDVASSRSTVIYGYHELEFEIVRALHVMVRGALGVHGDGIVGGAQLRLRIGEERRTNLVLGGDLFNQIGQRAFPQPWLSIFRYGNAPVIFDRVHEFVIRLA